MIKCDSNTANVLFKIQYNGLDMIMRIHFLEINSMDLSMKLVVDTSDTPEYSGMMDSRFDVNFHINAEKMKNRKDYSRDFSPGHYNLTASMKMTHLDDFRFIKKYYQIHVVYFHSD